MGIEGVECNTITGHVIQLSLNSTREVGLGYWYFNASLFLPFKQLRNLHLPDNLLVGWVENEGFERLSKLSNFKVLDLNENSFNCSILASLSQLSSLNSLYLEDNEMESPNPTNSCERLSRLSNLEILDLNDNYFSGGIESFLKLNDLTSLKQLDVRGDLIESFIPSQDLERLSVLGMLEFLDLRDNEFNNNILSSLNKLSSVKVLYLGFNQFNGSFNFKGNRISSNFKALYLNQLELNQSNVLQTLSAFSSLKTPYFQFNNFARSTITTQGLRNLSNLEELTLDGTFLDEYFLESMGTLTSLKVLSVASCRLNGHLPTRGGVHNQKNVLFLQG